jgi:HK97 family phage major capsid protein
MPDIITPDKNPLHELKDAVLAQTDEVNKALRSFEEQKGVLTKEQQDVRASYEQTKVLLENVNKRMDEMDKLLPKFDKGYIPANGEDATAASRRGLGEWMVDLARGARKMEPKFGRTTNQKEGTDTMGGYLVPPEFNQEVIKLVSNFGFARKYCRIMPMTREIMNIPLADYMPTTLVNGNVTASGATKTQAQSTEGSAVAQTGQTFTQAQLVAARLMAIDQLTIEVDEDSDPSLMNFLVDVFAEAIALAEDYQVLRADHTPFTGILSETGVGSYTLPSGSVSFKNIAFKDLVGIYNSVDEKAQESGIWVMSNYAWNQIVTAMVDANGRPFALGQSDSPIANFPTKSIFNRPVVLSTMMPKAANDATGNKFVIYGDFRYALFGDRKRLSVDISPHAAFTTGELVMRFMERFAFQAVQKTVFAVGKTA